MTCLSPDDRSLQIAFETGALTTAGFDHRAHVRLAYTYLAEAPMEEAMVRMRHALRAFLRRHAIDPAKYHETLTRAWLLAVRHFMEASGPWASSEAFIEANPVLLDRKLLLRHYSPDVLFSDHARTAFLRPDLSPIPA